MNLLEQTYRERFDTLLTPLAKKVQDHILDLVDGIERIDRVSARPKAVERFLAKAAKLKDDGTPKYNEPLEQIQDQIGARIIVFYRCDVEALVERIVTQFRPIESQRIIPERESEFSYFGQHFILFFPTDLFNDDLPAESAPDFFELQIKTLYQHAWSEANHDLAYKPATPLSSEQKRLVAFTSAQSWGADRIFDDLHAELSENNCTR